MNPCTLEENIAHCIRKFPSEELLKLAKTEDQQKYWKHLASFYLCVSQSWLDDLQGNDLLLEGVKDKTLNRWYYDAIMARVNLLQSLWKLINLGYLEIYAALVEQNYPYLDFVSAPKLFLDIVQTQANNTFNICVKPYHNVSNQTRVKAWNIFSNYCSTGKIKPQELNSLKSAVSQYAQAQNTRLLFCLKVIERAINSGNKELLYKLKIYEEALIEDMKLSATGLSRTRSSQNFEKFSSFTWHKGRIVPANKTGGTYSL